MTVLDNLLATVEGDWQLLEEVMDIYFTDAPTQLSRIQRAIDSNDPLEVREAAHSLKGATGAFGKDNAVFRLAFNLEQIGQSGQLAQARERFQELEAAIVIMERTLKEGVAQHKGDRR
ncbi:MAG: Hpt domain-containing protein [Magnetococcales bacterium]|nr:Hpt domain-containing protein [Magnetococcales bacterium]